MILSVYFLLTQLGLILDICGAILLFAFGLPSKVRESAGNFLVDGANEEEENSIYTKNKRIQCWAYTGLILLILGFILQFIGNFK